MEKIISGGTIITAEETYRADILIKDEKITQIFSSLENYEGYEVIDATGKLILPGGVDVHTHFDLPMFGTVSSDDHYTGHKAAAFGGTTTVIDFIPQDFSPLVKNVDVWHQKVTSKAAIDFGFHMNITRYDKNLKNEIPLLLNEGITSLKVFTAYNNRLRLNDGEIFQVMRIAAEHGFLTMMHAENGDIIDLLVEEALAMGKSTPEWHAYTRPSWGAVEAVARGAAFSAQTGAPLYIVHMNAAGEVDQLKYAREQGLPVMGETCPQYLFFTVEELKRDDGSKWICSPPMRTKYDNLRLWKGIQDQTIQVLATDHCPFFYDGSNPIIYEGNPVAIPGKELGKDDFTKIPNGLPGVGDRMVIMWTEAVTKRKMTANLFVKLTATNPAKIFGLYPQKGTILPGSDADLVIWDPEQEIKYGVEFSQQRTDYNLYEGWHLTGYPEKVFLRGKMIVNQQEWLGEAGEGNFIHRDLCKTIL
ncbi:MAG: dihydropyrimidinase [Anaerolineaceae bacterium]|nr:dihydropyrimidinase [Anaerolineaceae bacterium]